MNRPTNRALLLAAVAVAGVGLVAWLATTQGPLAPVKVTVASVEQGSLAASAFGIGILEPRRSYSIGPTTASRVARVLVDQGDRVTAGQLLAELDPVDMDDRVEAARFASERAASTIRAAEAQLGEARSRSAVAGASARRWSELQAQGFVSKEAVEAKRHEANAGEAAAEAAAAQRTAALRDLERARADFAASGKLRAQARLRSPVDGVVSARLVEPGTTVVAGQAVLQVIDPATLWVKTRIDQGQAGGVLPGRPARIVLRSDPRQAHDATVERVDWVSDAVTEERIVNVGFKAPPDGLSVGELAEVTIRTVDRAGARILPAAAVKRVGREDGVWRLDGGRIAFQPVKVGITTLDGRSEILDGAREGDAIVVHSERSLDAGMRVKVVEAIVRPAK
jgi:HlyD family secretion protein